MDHNLKSTKNNLKDGCNSAANNQRLSELDFNTTELAVLSIIRLICANYASTSNKNWDLAHHRAEELWAPFSPRLLVGAIVGLARSIKVDRSAPFSYMSATCIQCGEYICSDELDLMRVLQSACQKDTARLHCAAAILAGSNHPNDIIRAAHQVANLMTACHRQPNVVIQKPMSAVQHTVH